MYLGNLLSCCRHWSKTHTIESLEDKYLKNKLARLLQKSVFLSHHFCLWVTNEITLWLTSMYIIYTNTYTYTRINSYIYICVCMSPLFSLWYISYQALVVNHNNNRVSSKKQKKLTPYMIYDNDVNILSFCSILEQIYD